MEDVRSRVRWERWLIPLVRQDLRTVLSPRGEPREEVYEVVAGLERGARALVEGGRDLDPRSPIAD